MKINIVFPYNLWSGAFRSTYELANRMAVLGHDVKIYIPFFPYLTGATSYWDVLHLLFRGLLRSIIRWNRLHWFDLKVPIKVVPLISNQFIQDADVIISNHWPTAFSVAKLSSNKGRKFNFIRDTTKPIADGFIPILELESFRLPLNRIVVSPWLKDFLNNEVGVSVAGVVPNGTNFKDFEVTDRVYNNPPVVCMMYYNHPIKGMADGFKVLKQLKDQYPEIRILMFGLNKPKNLPFDAEFYHRPFKEKLRSIYSQSDIYLFTSLQEGSGNTPREAMAAGCAVVSTNVGCIPECVIPGETGLVVEPGDVNGMVEAISGLIANPSRIDKIGRRAQEHIRQFNWDKSTTRLLEILSADDVREEKP